MTAKQEIHVGVVRDWCQALGVLTAVSISRHEAEMKMAAYVPLLMREFTDAAFTQDSLSTVARQCVKGFPTYPELTNALSGWWREHRPTPPALPAPLYTQPEPEPREPPTPEMIAHVEAKVREVVSFLKARPEAEIIEPKPRYLTNQQLAAAYSQLEALGGSGRVPLSPAHPNDDEAADNGFAEAYADYRATRLPDP